LPFVGETSAHYSQHSYIGWGQEWPQGSLWLTGSVNAWVRLLSFSLAILPQFYRFPNGHGEEALLKDLRQRFAFLGESTSTLFLFGVGEEMPQTLQKMQEMHETTH
jgi:hypothetical protein